MADAPEVPMETSADGAAKSYSSIMYKLYADISSENYDLKKITNLESSGLLERELWPSFPYSLKCFKDDNLPCFDLDGPEIVSDADNQTSVHQELTNFKATVMVIACLLNEKFRQRVNVWESMQLNEEHAEAASRLRYLVYAAWLLFLCPRKFALRTKESSILVQLFIYLFQSLEHEAARKVTMSICGLPTWIHLGQEQKTELLLQRPELNQIWKAVLKRYRKFTTQYGEDVKFNSPGLSLQSRFTLLDRDALDMALNLFLNFIEREAPAKIDQRNLRNVIMDGWTAVDVFSGKPGIEVSQNEIADGAHLEFRNEDTTDIRADEFLFCERFLEFLIDIMSQLPTRRFFRPVFLSSQLLPRLRLSSLYRHTEAALIRQLATLLTGYEVFEVDDVTGEALHPRDLEAQLYERLKELQVVCYKLFPENERLKEAAMGPVAALSSATALREFFSDLTLSQLLQIAEKLKLVEALTFAESALYSLLRQSGSERATAANLSSIVEENKELPDYKAGHQLLVEVLSNHLHRRPNQLNAINRLPLFPTAALIWDPNIVPTEKYQGDFSLALPKLNLQFLTLHDYLLRNFHLFRLESAYEIREDLEDAVWRMKAIMAYGSVGPSGQDKLETLFTGFSHMASPIDHFSIVFVKEPEVGSDIPSQVRGEIIIDLKKVPKESYQGWDNLRQFDVIFLLAVRAPIQPFTGRPTDLQSVAEFREKFGVVDVRGCEIVEVLDEEGKTISDPNSNGQPDSVPFGTVRTLRVTMDANQYQRDLHDFVAQTKDVETDIYSALNLVVRRNPAENNFKSVLETIRDLMADTTHTVIPEWLHDIFLGYGDPTSAQYFNLPSELSKIDFVDTFLDDAHIREAFPNVEEVEFQNGHMEERNESGRVKNLSRIVFSKNKLHKSSTAQLSYAHPTESKAIVELYNSDYRGPYTQCAVKRNSVRFTPCQIEAIRSGVNPGLTLVVGPPGTGKTDTAVQIALLLHKNFPEERILILAHSNQALNDLFEKIAALDIDERYLLRLGMGEKELRVASDRNLEEGEKKDFSKWGRVNHMLQRRLDLLQKVDLLGISLNVPGDVGASCDTAVQFYRRHVVPRIKRFRRQLALVSKEGHGLRVILRDLRIADETTGLKIGLNGFPIRKMRADPMKDEAELKRKKRKNIRPFKKVVAPKSDEEKESDEDDPEHKISETEMIDDAPEGFPQKGSIQTKTIEDLDDEACIRVQNGTQSVAEVLFPFFEFFADVANNLFPSDNLGAHGAIAEGCFRYISELFKAIEECRAFELLRNLHDRTTYLLTRHAKIIAMTCTHAALVRHQMLDLRLRYDTLIMEEAGQVLEIETFIPMVLQKAENESSSSRLKRVILLGDHHQLPPVVKNRQHGRLDQSMFSRFIRLRVPFIQLDRQGRCRPSLRELFSWRYTQPPLLDLPKVATDQEFHLANPGITREFQFIDVPDFEGRGEHCPMPHFYQNLGEAEFATALFMYMRLLGYPNEKIAILTTYNGQKALLKDTVQRRCGWNPLIGWPSVISTVDKFQGQQADYVILSLVRTYVVGHLRDVRRLIVAVSRARLGLYIFGRHQLFSSCLELQPLMNKCETRILELNLEETTFSSTRRVAGSGGPITRVHDVHQMLNIVQHTAKRAISLMNPSNPPPDSIDMSDVKS